MTNAAGTNSGSTTDFETIRGDIAVLKRDLATLLNHLKLGAKGGAGDAAAQLGEEAKRVYDALAEQGERSAKSAARFIEEQPLLCLLGAFALGFIGARLLSR